MPIGTPFHSRTSALCTSQNWRTWSGYLVASSYDVLHDYEYHAIRNAAALIDVSPLFKYDVRGKDALRLVNRVITRDATKCAVGQAIYACLCDAEGKVIQDGTVFRLEEDCYRLHLADPGLRWLKLNAVGMEVSIEEVSEQVAALALQGPNSLTILERVADASLGQLRFFRFAFVNVGGVPAIVSRTGYTGDLGYEVWVAAGDAEPLWDVLMTAGGDFGIRPAGIYALDVARLEAGFILLEVDYIGVEKALTPSQKYTPFEIGLGWTVDLKKEHFVGLRELRSETERSASRQVVGLEIDLLDYEQLYQQVGLPPQMPLVAWRSAVPVYKQTRQVGHATTGAWSPILKKYIALATIGKEYVQPGARVDFEVTVEYRRKTVGATVVKLPFFDPPRKRAVWGSPGKA
jgi:aminomethyltransferase